MGHARIAAGIARLLAVVVRRSATAGDRLPCSDAIRTRGRFAGCVLVCAAAIGCGGWRDSEPSPRYLPDWPEARAALETALSSWRDGTPDDSPSHSVGGAIFLDKQRRPGEKLHSFAILGQSTVENVRQFTVRLLIEGQSAPRLVRYNVLGRNPAWVFRLEDFEGICHWEHPMEDEPASRPESPAGTVTSASDRGR